MSPACRTTRAPDSGRSQVAGTKTTALVMLASEQLMPNVVSLLALREADAHVSDVLVYCTSDEQRSLGPGRKLEDLAARLFPSARVIRHAPAEGETGADPGEVFGAVERWRDGVDSDELIINATGGRKTMFAGCLGFVGRSGVRLVYFDAGSWLEIRRDGDAFVSVACDFGERDLREPFRELGVEGLLEVQAGAARLGIGHVEPMDVIETMGRLVENGWQWDELPAGGRAGPMFERWFASLLQQYGFDDVRMNVKAMSDAGESAQYESDVWALWNDRLFLFDIKLANGRLVDASLAEQINNAASQARDLAGSMATAILVRPGYLGELGNPGVGVLAQRLRCRLWYQEDMVELPQRLAELVGGSGEATLLQALSGRIGMSVRRYGWVFADPGYEHVNTRSEQGARGKLPLGQLFEYRVRIDRRNGHRTRWLCVRSDGGALMCRVCAEDRVHLAGWLDRVRAHGFDAIQLGKAECLILEKGEPGRLNRFLKQHQGGSVHEPLFRFPCSG